VNESVPKDNEGKKIIIQSLIQNSLSYCRENLSYQYKNSNYSFRTWHQCCL